MLQSLKERFDREDEGFTLIELMVVVLIIAILLAIAIPTFLGARNAANARAAQSNLRNALTAEQTNWTNNQAFSTDLSTLEPSLSWVAAWPSSVSPNTVLVSVDTNNSAIVTLTALGKDGNCWSITQINDPAATTPADGTYYAKTTPATSTSCASPIVPTANATNSSAGNAAASTSAAPAWYTSF